MARRKSKKGGAGLGLLLLAIIFIALILTITPFVLFFGWLISFFQYARIKRKVKGNLSDFWLSATEKTQFQQVAGELSKAIGNIDKANQLGDSEGVGRNQDGQFSARGNRGKELRSFINQNQAVVNKHQDTFIYLQELPQQRWYSFRKKFSRAYAFGFGFIAWGASLVYFVKQSFGDIKEGLEAVAYYPIDVATMAGVMFLGGKPPDNPDRLTDWKIMLTITGISVLTYFIVLLITRLMTKAKSPFPPKVTGDNYDKN